MEAKKYLNYDVINVTFFNVPCKIDKDIIFSISVLYP